MKIKILFIMVLLIICCNNTTDENVDIQNEIYKSKNTAMPIRDEFFILGSDYSGENKRSM